MASLLENFPIKLFFGENIGKKSIIKTFFQKIRKNDQNIGIFSKYPDNFLKYWKSCNNTLDNLFFLEAPTSSSRQGPSAGFKSAPTFYIRRTGPHYRVVLFFLEAPTRFELVIRVLQTHALPLGYSAG